MATRPHRCVQDDVGEPQGDVHARRTGDDDNDEDNNPQLLARECVSTEYCVYATETGTEDNMAGPSGHAGSGCMAVLPSAPDRGNHESSG